MKKTVFTFLAAAFMAAMPAAAQDKPEANISADLVSQYIWRGMELGRASSPEMSCEPPFPEMSARPAMRGPETLRGR